MGDQAERLRQLVRNKQQYPPLRVITVTSGKGGVGKSFFTVNLSLALTARGMRVLVIDADFGLANIDIMLGSAAAYNLKSVLCGEKKMHEIIQTGRSGVRFISGGNGIYELLNMDEDSVVKVLESMAGLSDVADIILLDTGAGINNNILQLIMAGTEVVVITTPEPTSLVDAYAMIKTVCETRYASEIHLVMNKARTRKEADNASNSLSLVVMKNLGRQLSLLGPVAWDDEVSKTISQFTPLFEKNPRSAAARDIVEIAGKLLTAKNVELGQNRSNLTRFFSGFTREKGRSK